MSTIRDPSSFANPDEARVTHTDFEIDVDFESNVLRCWARHQVVIEAPGADSLLLDTHDLTISAISVNGNPVETIPGPSSEALGQAVAVPLPQNLPVRATATVELRWTTSPAAVAAQWLAPSQTAGGVHPFLFTQCQAIHARSLAPCQDSPGAKFTYTAAVRAPAPLRALMSALPADDHATATASADLEQLGPAPAGAPPSRVFRFRQPLPISSYLLALAVGDLVSAELSPTSAVWAEPSTIGAAAHEFADTPRFLEAAESLAGPYRWGRYDLLLLPPSFPYGGMENVNLTFVTPTLLAGDRSLANVVAHEIAHSWTGNLVTNATWSSFWLNEGFTMYLERRIQAVLEGSESAFDFHASLGWITLKKSVATWGADHPFTALVPDLSSGCDPDDAFSSIPYEKGFAFVAYLERVVGGKDAFLPFFRAYLDKFASTPVTSDAFKSFFLSYYADVAKVKQKMGEIDWDAWFYGTGMPPVELKYDESLAQAAYDLAARWHTSDVMGLGTDGPAGASAKDMEGWTAQQVVAFLDRLGELRALTPMAPRTLRAMAAAYPILESTKNTEIRCAWYLLGLKAGDSAALPGAEEMLSSQGRMKFVRPLYRAMATSTKLQGGRERALACFERNKDKYHPICAKMAAADLKLGGAEGPAGDAS